MKKITSSALLILAILGAVLGFSNTAAAQDKNWSVDLSAGVFTDYMFRGINMYDGVSVQPVVGASYDTGDWGVIGASVWSHLSAEGGESASEKFTENDFTLNYDMSFDSLTLSLGHIWYVFPEDSDGLPNTNEYFASLAFDVLLNPTLTFYQDYDEFDNQYYEVGVSHTLTSDLLGEGFNLTPFVTLGFASDAEKVYADDGLVYTTFGASFDAKLGDITVTPSLNVTRESDEVTDNEFWAGTSFSWSY